MDRIRHRLASEEAPGDRVARGRRVRAPPCQPQDAPPRRDDRLVWDRPRHGAQPRVRDGRVAHERRRQSSPGAACCSRAQRRSREDRAHRHAPLRLRVPVDGSADRHLRPAEAVGHRSPRLPRPRHDDVDVLRRPRRQQRRAAGRQLRRRLVAVVRVRALGPRVRRKSDRDPHRSRSPRRRARRRAERRRDPPSCLRR